MFFLFRAPGFGAGGRYKSRSPDDGAFEIEPVLDIEMLPCFPGGGFFAECAVALACPPLWPGVGVFSRCLRWLLPSAGLLRACLRRKTQRLRSESSRQAGANGFETKCNSNSLDMSGVSLFCKKQIHVVLNVHPFSYFYAQTSLQATRILSQMFTMQFVSSIANQ